MSPLFVPSLDRVYGRRCFSTRSGMMLHCEQGLLIIQAPPLCERRQCHRNRLTVTGFLAGGIQAVYNSCRFSISLSVHEIGRTSAFNVDRGWLIQKDGSFSHSERHSESRNRISGNIIWGIMLLGEKKKEGDRFSGLFIPCQFASGFSFIRSDNPSDGTNSFWV